MKEALCKMFCDGISVVDVPVGLSVSTNFRRGDERLGFFVVKKSGNKDLARLEDDGLTIAFLQDSGVNVMKEPRSIALAQLMEEFSVHFDKDDFLFYTEFRPLSDIPSLAVPFLEFLIRVQQFTQWTKDRVEETFKYDILEAVKQRFCNRADVLVDQAPSDDLSDYIADIVVRPEGALPPLAIYIGTSEMKALEALVFQQAAELAGISCHVALIVRSVESRRIKGAHIKERTLSRASQKFLVVPYLGHEEDALNKLEQEAFSPVFVSPKFLPGRLIH